MEVRISDLLEIYEKEIKINVKNKKKLFNFEKNKMEYLIDIKRILETKDYDGGRYNIFLIYKPKIRIVMSQSIYDKIVNHYITRHILMPKYTKYLSNRNCATRKNMGITYAIKLLKNDIEKYKKYHNFYFLKMDISKYFYSIDHNVLLNIMTKELNEEEYNIIKNILNSTNKNYINETINRFSEKLKKELPLYNYNKGLPIGNLSSQFLAILYLSDLHHYITHDLKLTFINYMDDYIIIHENKEYLKYCMKIIVSKLKNEYKLDVNKNKTFISSSKQGINFLGYNFKVINNKTIIKLCNNSKRNIKRGIKRIKYLYNKDLITFKQIFSSIENYKNGYPFASRQMVSNIVNRYWY